MEWEKVREADGVSPCFRCGSHRLEIQKSVLYNQEDKPFKERHRIVCTTCGNAGYADFSESIEEVLTGWKEECASEFSRAVYRIVKAMLSTEVGAQLVLNGKIGDVLSSAGRVIVGIKRGVRLSFEEE